MIDIKTIKGVVRLPIFKEKKNDKLFNLTYIRPTQLQCEIDNLSNEILTSHFIYHPPPTPMINAPLQYLSKLQSLNVTL